jgi:4-amino-4-deoxy-L-arabinose transferase-like glycosyltransferase
MATVPSRPDGDLSTRFVLVALGGLVLASFAVRLWLLHTAMADAAFSFVDADGYLRNARRLAQDGEGWRWTRAAIRYPYDGRDFMLPPLYPVFLSLFVLVSDAFRYWAAVGQIALNAFSAATLYVIAASLHTRRAGLVAAFAFAFWIPNIWTYGLFIQEQLYIPLLLAAFALLLRATANAASPAAFACAGIAFGFVALTRSMPMYFVVPAAIGYVLMTRDRMFVRRAAALVGGFLLVTGLYSLWLSDQVGQFVYIENHGGISIHKYGGTRTSGVPGFADIVRQLSEVFWRDPQGFFIVWRGYALALFHVHGDRWLQAYIASTAEGAAAAKFVAHAGIDLPFIATVVLSPLGAVLARRSREAALLGLWVAITVVLTAFSAYGGVRYRAPFEPHLIALASVVLAGAWRRPRRAAWIVGTLTAGAVGYLLVVQLPRVARAKANYGLNDWGDPKSSRRPWALGQLGVNLLPKDGFVEINLYALEPVSAEHSPRASVRIDGHHLADLVLDTEPTRLRFLGRHQGFHYVEVSATDAAGRPVRFGFDAPPMIVDSAPSRR